MSAANLIARIESARSGHQRAKDLFADARAKNSPEEVPSSPNSEEGISLSDIGHAALDVAGFIPVVGALADLANAGWYAAEGDYTNAALSAASAVPGVGDAVAAAKVGVKVTGVVAGAAVVGARGAGRLPNQADALIDGGRQVSGRRFPDIAGSNEVLYKTGQSGRTSYYQVYGSDGMPVKRVDLDSASKPHFDKTTQQRIPPPHVQEYTRQTNPNTGQTFPKRGIVRAARPDEIPNVN